MIINYKASDYQKRRDKMFDNLINELENIRISYLNNWTILSNLSSIGLVTISFIIFYFQKGETLKQKFIKSLLFILPIFGIFIFTLLIAYSTMLKNFSFIAKEKIFSSIKKLGDDIEIISYRPKDNYLENIARKIYRNFNKYNQEDNFTIRINGKDIKICELELRKKIRENRYTTYRENNATYRMETIFQGIVISIPKIYAKNEIKEYKIVIDNIVIRENYTHIFISQIRKNYNHIFISQGVDISELSVLEPVKQEDIEKIIKQLKDYVNIASKFIKN